MGEKEKEWYGTSPFFNIPSMPPMMPRTKQIKKPEIAV
jgi:hypothetical protein